MENYVMKLVDIANEQKSIDMSKLMECYLSGFKSSVALCNNFSTMEILDLMSAFIELLKITSIELYDIELFNGAINELVKENPNLNIWSKLVYYDLKDNVFKKQD